MKKQLSAAATAALRESTVDGLALHLPPAQLDPKVYAEVKAYLLEQGAKWNRHAPAPGGRKGAHVFTKPGAAEALIAALTGDSPLMIAGNVLAYYSTPAEIADRVIARLRLPAFDSAAGARLLEPSAGTGALILAVQRQSGEQTRVWSVEIDKDRARHLTEMGVRCVQGDFLSFDPGAPELGGDLFDAVAMNPPFTAPGHPHAWAEHFLHAADWVEPGWGTVAAILPNSLTFAQGLPARLRAALDADGASIEPLPEGAFKESGTGAQTVLVVWRRAVSSAVSTLAYQQRRRSDGPRDPGDHGLEGCECQDGHCWDLLHAASDAVAEAAYEAETFRADPPQWAQGPE